MCQRGGVVERTRAVQLTPGAHTSYAVARVHHVRQGDPASDFGPVGVVV